ncbi:hypothetical protein GCM10010174_83320 [Kutzneria viridogrisea]|uniref:Secreted protein n=2 Tax=Kutzneria TaxID=43356 RepID=W5WPY4_9PSEU|nr:hypothetical protein [Kutzneria albida]AHI00225.1 hypothetical protein KALB_6866 [Kutzneria albida DSM 43870]MBA8925401.1 hypothetical protein [Kutzneria viridogrisea]
MRRLAAVGALLFLVGACGQPSQPTVPDNKPASNGQPANGILPGADRAVPENRVDGTRLPKGYPRQAWTDENGGTLTVQAQEGGCEHAKIDLAEQSATAVRVVLIRDLTDTNRVCTKDLRLPKLSVQLDKPLADRTVVLEQQTIRS